MVKHRAEIAHVEPAFKEVKLNPLAHFEFRSRLLWINGPLSNADIKFTISYLAGTNFRLAVFLFGLGVPREGMDRALPGSSGRMPSLGALFW